MKSVICVLVKDEQQYIEEWVQHNLDIGFDCIYIYEDFSSTSHEQVLQDYINNGKVILTPLSGCTVPIANCNLLRGSSTQHQLFEWFFDQCKSKKIEADWIGYFDVDEFLVFDDGYDLNKIQKLFINYGAVYPCWVMYGANGNLKKPEGRVVDNYKTPHNLYDTIDGKMWYHKSLVNVSKCDGMKNIHTFNNGVFTDGTTYADNILSFSKCHLNHYFTKSWEEYCERMQRRGNMANNNRSYDTFFKFSEEFSDKEREMLEYVRWNTTNLDTMWISKKYHIISGGNKNMLNQLNQKYGYQQIF